tara:strand:- start:6275 stop:6709 length:435 start_codon:yes stop_codon:yes gene_type:complete
MKYIDPAKRVYVYWNLHKNCWSVKQGGKVKGHVDKLTLKDCRFLVGKAGRDRVRREGKKNVHAGVSGYVEPPLPWWVGNRACFVTYNPYKHDTFIQRTGVCDDKWPRPVTEARFVEMYIKDNKPVVMAIDFSPPTEKIGADHSA